MCNVYVNHYFYCASLNILQSLKFAKELDVKKKINKGKRVQGCIVYTHKLIVVRKREKF